MATSDFTSLWDFSLAHYGKPSRAETCLELQDNYGVNINVVLWSLWLEAQMKWLSEPQLSEALEVIAPWHQGYVEPLRQLRRQLKRDFATDLAQVDDLRQHIKRAELQAEKHELLCLQNLALGWDNREKDLATKHRAKKELPKGGNLSLYLHYLHLPPDTIARAIAELSI